LKIRLWAPADDDERSPDLLIPATTANLLSLLLAPINSYQSVLTLLALPSYATLLQLQAFSTRRSIAHAIVSSVLKNETVIDTPEDVAGVLQLCHVLVKTQPDAVPSPLAKQMGAGRVGMDVEEMGEEQGWVARMVHLFRAEDLGVQFELLQEARRHFSEGAERMRFTFPPLINAAIKLARRYKKVEGEDEDWTAKLTNLFKFIHQIISVMYNRVEASDISLRLFLLAAQVADDCGFEELTYEFYVQAFTIYEESISESRAQLQAITLVISTLQQAKVFSSDNYDTLITKAALHGAKLLKKSHQATAVGLASHLWWQAEFPKNPEEEGDTNEPLRDGNRVLECLQKTLRIASSCYEEIISVQLYVQALDQYLYYFDRDVDAVTPKYINSLVELITSNIDGISASDFHPTSRAPPGLIEGVHTADMITRHFRNTLLYIRSRKERGSGRWSEVDIAGALIKMSVPQ